METWRGSIILKQTTGLQFMDLSLFKSFQIYRDETAYVEL